MKVLKSVHGVSDKDFEREFNNLAKLKHENIVRLLGFCNETEDVLIEHDGKQIVGTELHRALCFEYMHHKSLQDHLSGMIILMHKF